MDHDEGLPRQIGRHAPGDISRHRPGDGNRVATRADAPTAAWPEEYGGGPRESEIDWRRWAYVFWRRRWWIIAATVLGTALSVVSARGEKPVYEARAMLWVDAPERITPIEITQVFSAAGWVDLLGSYAVLDAVVHDLKLYLGPGRARDPQFENFELTDHLTPGGYRLIVRLDNTYALLDEEGRELQVALPGDTIGAGAGFRWVPKPELLPPGKEVTFSVRPSRAAADWLEQKLDVQMAQGGNFIRLTFSDQNPELVALVLNTIIDHFVSLAAELKRQKLTKLRSTLEERIEPATERLRRAETGLQEFGVTTIILPDDRRDQVRIPPSTIGPGGSVFRAGDPVFDRYFSLHVERDVLRQDREDLATIVRSLGETGNLDAMRLEIIPSVRTASSLLAALEEFGRKEVEHRALLYRYTPEHGEVQRIAGELGVLQRQTIPALVRQLMERITAREAQLEAEISTQTTELQRIPGRAIEESRLRREVALAEQLYNSLQVRYKEAEVAEAATLPTVRALDRASPPAYPLGNSARLKILVGFVLSLGLSVAGVIAHHQFVDRRVQYPEQVVEDLGLPILGVVPNLKALTAMGEEGEVESSPQAQGVVESFRALRTQLTLGLGIQYPAVIAITSPGMGDGKSLIASNLALAFADPNRSTVLIDGDVRRGRLHRIFGANRSPGLSDYLRGDAQIALVVRPTDTPGLYFTPRGHYSEEVPELLDGEGMPALLAELKQTFQVVLIDTPPLSAGVDAVLIGAHADAVLAVLRKGRTDLDLARAKLDSYAQMLGVPIVGAILNDVDAAGPYRYYTYSYDVYPYEPT